MTSRDNDMKAAVRMRRIGQAALPLALLAAAVAARLIGLDRGLWVDELKTWQVVRLPMENMLWDRFYQGHLPLYFLFMKAWLAATGPVDWLFRLPSVVMGVASVLVLLRLGREHLTEDAALTAAALMTIHGLDLWASQTARMYALLSLLTLASSLFLLRLDREGGWRDMAALIVLNALGLITHVVYAFVLAGQIAYLLLCSAVEGGRWMRQRRPSPWKPRLRCVTALLLACAAASPVWTHLSRTKGRVIERTAEWKLSLIEKTIRTGGLRLAVGDFDEMGYGRPVQAMAYLCAIPAFLGAVGAAGSRCVRRRLRRPFPVFDAVRYTRASPAPRIEEAREAADDRAARLLRYAVCVVATYLLGMLLFANLVQDKVAHGRYYSPLTGLVCIAFAATIHAIAWPRLRLVYASLLVVTLMLTSVAWWRYRGDGGRQAMEYIESRRVPGERVILCNFVAAGNIYMFYRPEAQPDLVPVSRYTAQYSDSVSKRIVVLRQLAFDKGAVNESVLRQAFGNDPTEEARLRPLTPLFTGGPEADATFRNLYKNDASFLKALDDLRRLLIDNAPPGRSLWLFIHNEDGLSPIVELPRTIEGFALLEQRRFSEAAVYRYQRFVGPAEAPPLRPPSAAPAPGQASSGGV